MWTAAAPATRRRTSMVSLRGSSAGICPCHRLFRARARGHERSPLEVDAEEVAQDGDPLRLAFQLALAAVVFRGGDEAHPGQAEASVLSRPAAHRSVEEVGAGGRLLERAHLGELLHPPRLEREGVLGFTVLVEHHTAVLTARHAVRVAVAILVAVVVQAKRAREARPEADVGEPGPVEVDTEGQVGEVGRRRGAQDDRRGVAGDGEAERLEQEREEPVQLVAPPAPAAGDDLLEDVLRVEDVRNTEVDVEVLERHGQHVRAVQLPERALARLTRPGISNALEIRIDVHPPSLARAVRPLANPRRTTGPGPSSPTLAEPPGPGPVRGLAPWGSPTRGSPSTGRC